MSQLLSQLVFKLVLRGVPLLLANVVGCVNAAAPHTEHTFRLAADEPRPAATLADADWLIGRWQGTAFGARFDETWNTPSAATMVGTFKLYDDAGVQFYELLTLSVEAGTLSLKVKHFNADFTAWEDKQDFVNFRLVAKTRDALHFGGISFYRRGPDRIDGYLVMKQGDEVREHHLAYRRVAADASAPSP